MKRKAAKTLVDAVREAKEVLLKTANINKSGRKGKEEDFGIQRVYKIKRTSDGLFATGGTSVSFNKRGKTWATLGALKNHLRQEGDERRVELWASKVYYGCVVVECVVRDYSTSPVNSFFKKQLGGK